MDYKCEKVVSDINRTITVDDKVYDVYTGEIVAYTSGRAINETYGTYRSGLERVWNEEFREYQYMPYNRINYRDKTYLGWDGNIYNIVHGTRVECSDSINCFLPCPTYVSG